MITRLKYRKKPKWSFFKINVFKKNGRISLNFEEDAAEYFNFPKSEFELKQVIILNVISMFCL